MHHCRRDTIHDHDGGVDASGVVTMIVASNEDGRKGERKKKIEKHYKYAMKKNW